MKHLVIIDGHHLMYRAYWAIPRTLTTKSGEQINTVFGMASMLLQILKTEQPDGMVICFDEGEETFRHQESETYKAGRAETPDDFYVQIPRVMELLQTFQFAMVSDKKYEADDFLGAYAMAAEKAGWRVSIVTGDRDAFQLATENIKIVVPHSGYQQPEYLGPSEIEAKYGIRPDQVPAYKGLIGDSSDNLPGVKGIGPKTAADLLQTYDTLENIYDHLPDIRESVRKKLEADREQAFFCQHMAKLICDLPLPISLEDTLLRDIPLGDISQLFQTLTFSLLTRRMQEFAKTEYGQRICTGQMVADSASHTEIGASQMTLF